MFEQQIARSKKNIATTTIMFRKKVICRCDEINVLIKIFFVVFRLFLIIDFIIKL